ncbi:Peptidyl-prolyl cis-trans isomerase CYP26-2, chloroplastic [Ananas comosus]|uniref:Peptidyl-prolyl cis-trans isomerase CYP26-2, chloroplastic n=1 Tax=Ananas comosus TaxID=4615 RepID=A0A199UFX3_ANACO|nr:Peptidyl-prolyl cis-trans isomerase CYP26-2, chloroplastic [Ananas comosus]
MAMSLHSLHHLPPKPLSPPPPSPPHLPHQTLALTLTAPPPPPLLLSTLSRRSLALVAAPLLLLPAAAAAAADDDGGVLCPGEAPTTARAFLDVAIDGAPAGRIVVALRGGAAPLAAARFAALVSGAAGVSYRRKEFVRITPSYVQHAGVRSYGADAERARRAAGSDLAASSAAEGLAAEWAAARRRCGGDGMVAHEAGAVGVVVRDPARAPPRPKLVARRGRLEVEEEVDERGPNGTEFVIAARDAPELDAAAVVVGWVVEGMDVVERIAMVKTVKDNTSSPYFRVAKLIGDKRAVVAERGFNRPYSKVVVTNCGLLD